MRAPAWLRLRRRAAQPDPRFLVFSLTVDTAQWNRVMTDMAASLARVARQSERAAAERALFRDHMAGARAGVTAIATNWALAAAKRHEVRLAGQEARWYVRGAMDPSNATPEARDARVRRIMAGRDTPRDVLAAYAAAFIRGWVEHHPDPCRVGPCCGDLCEGFACWECRGTGHPHEPVGADHEPVGHVLTYQHPGPHLFYRQRYVLGWDGSHDTRTALALDTLAARYGPPRTVPLNTPWSDA